MISKTTGMTASAFRGYPCTACVVCVDGHTWVFPVYPTVAELRALGGAPEVAQCPELDPLPHNGSPVLCGAHRLIFTVCQCGRPENATDWRCGACMTLAEQRTREAHEKLRQSHDGRRGPVPAPEAWKETLRAQGWPL